MSVLLKTLPLIPLATLLSSIHEDEVLVTINMDSDQKSLKVTEILLAS